MKSHLHSVILHCFKFNPSVSKDIVLIQVDSWRRVLFFPSHVSVGLKVPDKTPDISCFCQLVLPQTHLSHIQVCRHFVCFLKIRNRKIRLNMSTKHKKGYFYITRRGGPNLIFLPQVWTNQIRFVQIRSGPFAYVVLDLIQKGQIRIHASHCRAKLNTEENNDSDGMKETFMEKLMFKSNWKEYILTRQFWLSY